MAKKKTLDYEQSRLAWKTQRDTLRRSIAQKQRQVDKAHAAVRPLDEQRLGGELEEMQQ